LLDPLRRDGCGPVLGQPVHGQHYVCDPPLDSTVSVARGAGMAVRRACTHAVALDHRAGHGRLRHCESRVRGTRHARRSARRSRSRSSSRTGRCMMVSTALILLLVLLGLSIPVGAALGVLGLILDPLYSMLPLTQAMGEVSWSTCNEFLMVAIPLFILLGEILLRSGMAEKMYGAMSLWLSWLPGGLMHANIGASALFSATSGSSVATAATVGTVAIPEIKKQGYNESLFL